MLQAILFINLAFLSYTAGVWGERIQGELKTWHLLAFWFGLLNDIAGTLGMEEILRQQPRKFVVQPDFHTITGVLALTLMLLHAVWATIVIIRRNRIMIKKFHHYSLFVWVMWLIPFVSGAVEHLL
jgi:uncharacterized repeat protein (TIGR03987 family)